VRSIFFITTSEIPSSKANSIQSIAMANNFSKNGYKIFFLSRKNKSLLNDLNLNIKTYRFYSLSGKFIDFIFSFFLVFFSKLKKADLVFSRNLYVIFFSVIFNIDSVIELHRPYSDKNKISFYMLKFLFKKKKLIKIIYISNALKKIYCDIGLSQNQNKEIVLHDGANYSVFLKNNFISKKTSIGYAGSFQEGRGLDIINKLSFYFPNIQFNIAGGLAEEESKYKKFFKNNRNINYVGYINNREIQSFLMSNTYLIAPYKNKVFVDKINDTSQYMSPLKIFEYMNSERPIITSNLPVLKEVLRDGINSILCDPDKIYTWINGIKRLQSNKILCSYISINAKRDLKYKYNYNLRAKSILANL
jgi:glycosyltransferase involved in cell wall biosynthesis